MQKGAGERASNGKAKKRSQVTVHTVHTEVYYQFEFLFLTLRTLLRYNFTTIAVVHTVLLVVVLYKELLVWPGAINF